MPTKHVRIFVVSLALILAMSSLAAAAPRLRPVREDAQTATAVAVPQPPAQDAIWLGLDVSAAKSSLGVSDFAVAPGLFALYAADFARLEGVLARAPLEFATLDKRECYRVSLPMPDGTLQSFRVWDSPIMEPQLAAEFPWMKTYVGQGVDDPTATARLDVTHNGFHAQVLAAERTVYVDPYRANDTEHYISYDKRGLDAHGKSFRCLVDRVATDLADKTDAADKRGDGTVDLTNGGTLRTYRLAEACTGEYAAYQDARGSGTAAQDATAAIATTINRVTGIYERDLAIRLVLVGNNSSIVYTNASTDPFSNANPDSLLSQNQSICDSIIGVGNYDIGHVFSTGGGGLAGLGVVCVNGQKAQGETGSDAPVGDAFDVDYVAHEMGHQFGGDHTFNASTSGSCDSGNRNASTAYEPGSGSTIQAYAGICSPEDVQAHSDPYFHAISLKQMIQYAAGAGCGSSTANGNTAPTVALPANVTIPVSTPFTLTATGSDPNGDALTYCWEQWDLGTTAATKPLFRSLNPSTSLSRTFPKMSTVLAGASDPWEVLPTAARTMKFIVTARDNRAGGGGFAISGSNGTQGTITYVTVTFSGAAFSVAAPNTAVSWAGNTPQTVTWNKGGSTAANVRISLSTNGGTSWSTLIASTPNDGSEVITVPNTPSTTCRIRVEPTDNIYFDVSNVNFTITNGGGGGCTYSINPTSASPGSAATAGTVSVTTVAGCSWTATSNASWLTVTSGASGSGNGTVGYSVAANTGAARSGSLAIAGRTFTVNQAAGGTSGCTSSSTAINSGSTLSGSLATTDCTSTIRTGGRYYDNFTFAATAGTQYTITMNSTAFDTYLHLLNPGGASVAFDDDGNGGTNSRIVYTPSSGGTYTIHCTSYNASAVGAYTVSLAGGGGGGGGTELLTNGGFDTGAFSPWTASASRATIVSSGAQAGTYYTKLLGYGSTGTAYVYQAPAFAATGASRTLRFYLRMSSSESGSTQYDYLYVRVTNSAGTTLTTLATFTNANSPSYAGWTQVTLTIPASYAVSGNRLRFYATEDEILQTTFYIDSVSIQ